MKKAQKKITAFRMRMRAGTFLAIAAALILPCCQINDKAMSTEANSLAANSFQKPETLSRQDIKPLPGLSALSVTEPNSDPFFDPSLALAKNEAPINPTKENASRDKKVPAPALPPVAPELIFHGDRSAPRIAFTFDACETEKPARFDRELWDILVEKKIRATIFLGGRWMESHPQITKIIGKNSLIEIGNHSYIHPDFKMISRKKIRKEIKKTQDIQYRLMGKYGIVFRFPFGTYSKRTLKTVAETGLYPVQWDVASGDPSRSVTAKSITRAVLENATNGSIVIFHINGRGWNTAEALPGIVDELRARGFEFVTVSELMGFGEPTGQAMAK